ncbi:MAG: 2-oxoacid:acceptor oxidoreductase family protein [Nitrososphaerota archaeon]
MLIYARFHGRGGHGVKTASRILGTSAHLEGFHVQDFPIYGAERRGAPVTAFTKISDDPLKLLDRGYIFNPNLVLVSDESLLSDPIANPLSGIQTGGTAFINTTKNIDHLQIKHDNINIVVGDVTGLSLRYVGRVVLSTGIGAIATKLTGMIRWNSLEEAVKEELQEIGIRGELLEKNILLAKTCFELVYPASLPPPSQQKKYKIVELNWTHPPYNIPEIWNIGNTKIRKTGSWRVFKPLINLEKCTRCSLCVIYCPEGVIEMVDNSLVVDYDNCKGCLICFNECPVKAISYVREAEAV